MAIVAVIMYLHREETTDASLSHVFLAICSFNFFSLIKPLLTYVVLVQYIPYKLYLD